MPADSADCFFSQTRKKICCVDEECNKKEFFSVITPCWSVGRLIEISFLQPDMPSVSLRGMSTTETLIEYIIRQYEMHTPDFSKLEE